MQAAASGENLLCDQLVSPGGEAAHGSDRPRGEGEDASDAAHYQGAGIGREVLVTGDPDHSHRRRSSRNREYH